MTRDLKHTKKAYDKFGEDYHKGRVDPSKNFHHVHLEKPAMSKLLKNIVKNKRVLDLGCGSGVFTKDLVKWKAKATGIDLSKTLIDIAKKNLPSVKFFVGNALKTPFKKNEFEIVASNLVVHYFKEVGPLFKEVNRILKPNGIFVFSTHHPLIGIKRNVEIEGKKEKLLLPYFDNKRFTWNMMPDMEVVSYQHNFEHLVQGLYNSGFLVEQLLEPKPPINAKKSNKKSYDKTIKHPSLTVIKAIKIK